ncbi:MAG: hypothetical protein JXJ22_00210 [Bacteroidales bacterium]|nr:hypothetical protein [Bacteroidales bacterium]
MRFFLYLTLFFTIEQKTDYRTEFTFDYDWAINFYKQNHKQILQTCTKYNSDTAVIVSLLFPELIRYSIFQDFFETKALELIYVEYGKNHADYSIGYFQMKPSFAEQLESFVLQNSLLSEKYRVFSDQQTLSERKNRKKRIQRLKSFEWQLIYASCFYDATTIIHKSVQCKTQLEKIEFYATAYNYGFQKPEAEILEWKNAAIFPYGIKSHARQFRYSDIAADFYKNEYSRIFCSEFLRK